MKIIIVVIVVVLFLAALSLTTCIVVDKIITNGKLKAIKAGMTGYQIQEAAKTKLKFLSMSGDFYYAKLTSPMHFFKYNLVFKNGRLKEIEKM